MNTKAELVLNARSILGEGPGWDAENKLFYWVDIHAKQVHRYNPEKGETHTISLDQNVGAAVLRQSGGMMLALQNGFYELDVTSEKITLVADPEAQLPNNRFNDGKVDAAGRFWAGTMSYSSEHGAGSLYCLDTNMEVRVVLKDITISNGLAWSVDNQTMYYVDSPTKQVAAFDYDLVAGTISNTRIVVTIPEGEGVPDGMTIDANGMLWVAQWDGWKVSQWNPATGERLQTISVPAARVTSCCFGGDHLDELYITTARVGLDEQALAEQPLAGGIFRVKTVVPGLPANLFQG